MKNVIFLLFLLIAMTNQSFGDWTPPKNIDLRQVLDSAYDDRKNNNYKDALSKHIWFHDNALKINSSFYGVRLSYALSAWVELSNVYSPALEALEALSTRTERLVKDSGKCCRDAFHDYVSINRELGRENKVVELFKWMDANNPIAAKRNYDLAQPALISQREYILCGKYISPENDYSKLKEMYKTNSDMAKDPRLGAEMKSFADDSFVNGVTTLVAILTLNGQTEEAASIAEQSLSIMMGEIYEAELNKALSGKVPDPWP